MVRTSYLGELRTRKQSTNRAVPLDAVPERRTKRCFPRFQPGDRLCEPSFRYLSPGSEGEKCRPLDHIRQIPFIHSTRSYLVAIPIYTVQHSTFFLHVVHSTFKSGASTVHIWQLHMRSFFAETHIPRFRARYSRHVVFHTVRADVYAYDTYQNIVYAVTFSSRRVILC